MVQRMIWSVGLIMLVQSIGLVVVGENGATGVHSSCLVPEKKESQHFNGQLHLSSVKTRYTFEAHNNNSITFYHNINETSNCHNFYNTSCEFRVLLYGGINKTRRFFEGSFNTTLLPIVYNGCQAIPSATQVIFHLPSLRENDTDIYFFCMEVAYPPPYICKCDEGSIIQVKGIFTKKEVVEIQNLPLSLLIILGCLTAYSLIITTSFVYIMRNKRRMQIQQSEYINVVPRRPKNHKPCVPYATNPGHPFNR
ncbi:T-cell-specific surface glycoprotein CD28-like [Bufo bufo]|uniref:T-cell-specific surface glycoprotein CD28-like n=1 Tax=Bufo bufo TaxID=8384 RepID=UPI001ABEACAE|nr:T-cell-specific surface glycoprotein CD28-like [Bufo bufo]